jgi:hypothetical protein
MPCEWRGSAGKLKSGYESISITMSHSTRPRGKKQLTRLDLLAKRQDTGHELAPSSWGCKAHKYHFTAAHKARMQQSGHSPVPGVNPHRITPSCTQHAQDSKKPLTWKLWRWVGVEGGHDSVTVMVTVTRCDKTTVINMIKFSVI